MFIYSVKATHLKLFLCILAAVLVSISLIIFVPTDGALTVYADEGKAVYTEAKDNGGRITFLKHFGYEVEENPINETRLRIPSEPDEVFSSYNELQKLQGLNLMKYKRKEVTRYTYLITNYDGYDGRVLANLFVYRGRIIGGDVCSEDGSGFIHGFLKSVHL